MSEKQAIRNYVDITEQNTEAAQSITNNLPLTTSAVTPNVDDSLVTAEILVTPISAQTVTNQTGKSNYMSIII